VKIDNHKIYAELSSYLRGVDEKAQRQVPRPRDLAEPKTDRVEISRRSREVQKVREVVESVPDIRDARVNEVKKAIEDGTYNVRGEAIAEDILKRSLIDIIS